MAKFLGIQVAPSAFQSEGLNQVLDRMQAAGAHALCTDSIWLNRQVEPGAKGQVVRQPPLDVDGYERVLDRPLWGQRELWIERLRTHRFDAALFAPGGYRPQEDVAPESIDRELIHKMVVEARSRGMAPYIQVSPTLVPGLRPEHQMRYVDGSYPPLNKRVARQGCLNVPEVRAFMLGSVCDAVSLYPEAQGIYLDWVEFTTYQLPDHFGCTCEHCAARASALGYDWETILRDVRALWDWLHGLTAFELEAMRAANRSPSALVELLQSYPGWLQFLRFKADTVIARYREFRQAIAQIAGPGYALGANGWCPPFNRSSGLDYRRLAQVCDVVRPKLFTFHWSVMPRWYGQTLQQWSPALVERQILDAWVDLLGFDDDLDPRSYADYCIPAPTMTHPAKPHTWRQKLDDVCQQVGEHGTVHAYAHSYRPDEQWKRMVSVVRDSPVAGMWVQRYGYMSDSKLDILGQLWR